MGTHVNVKCRANARELISRRRLGWIVGLSVAIVLPCLQATPTWAQWSPSGVLLCDYATSCSARSPQIISDGHHGAYVAWSRILQSVNNELDNIYLQHVDWAGRVDSAWPVGGRRVTYVLSTQTVEGLVLDASGGVFVMWTDSRDTPGVNAQAFLSHFTTDGSLSAGWPAEGLKAIPDSIQGLKALAPDGQGGVFVTVVDYRLGGFEGDIYVQHVLADGTIAPGWPVLGKPVVRCAGQQDAFRQTEDGRGGLYFAWGQYLDSTHTTFGTQIQHMLPDGSIAWDSCGRTVAIELGPGAIVPSRAGGAIVDVGMFLPPSYLDDNEYTVGFDSTGTIRPEWAAGPLPVVVAAPGDQFNLDYASDGAGGLFVSWDDQRNYTVSATDHYVQHIADNGAPAPGWPANGVPIVASPIFDDQVGGGGSIMPDGSGGVYVLAERTGNNDPSSGIYAGHVAAGGQIAPGWSPAGETLTLPPFGDGADGAMLCSDDAGGAIAVISDLSILVQHISPDAPVPTEVSLVTADARSDGVSLEWYAGGGLKQAAVEREHGSDGWQELAQVTADGTGTLRYEDHAVVPGERYGYRLAYAANGTVAHTTETWVTVPVGARFGLAGAVTNPSAAGALSLRFSLASWAPAELSLYDLTGRRVWRREVGVLGAGEHTLAVGAEAALAPGLYWARLQQGARNASARVVLVP